MIFKHRTKIVATLGPAITQKIFTWEAFNDPANISKVKIAYENMEKCILAGLSVARFNFSHGTHEEQKIRIKVLQESAERVGQNVHMLLDTKGPEIRVLSFESDDGAVINEGSTVSIHSTEHFPGNSKAFCVTDSTKTYNMAKDLQENSYVLLDDGKLILQVKSLDVNKGLIVCEAKNTHTIKENKRVNLPGCDYSMPFFSDKDKADVLFAIENGFHYIALSFVNTEKDIQEVKGFIQSKTDRKIQIISKVETTSSIRNINEIIEASDGIMIARGDLGIEIPYAQVPYWEKYIIRECRKENKPVIVATQMLDSLERSPLPTRAEVTDVFFAAENGTDATMLSGETAQGQYPVEAVSVMGNILTKAEQAFNYVRGMTKMFVKSPLAKTPEGKQAIAIADAVIGKYIQEPVYTTITPMQLILFSNNPKLIQSLSSIRSFRAIIVITDKEEVYKGFGLNYGIFTYKIDSINLSSEEREAVFKELKKKLPDNSDAIYLE